MVVQKSTNIQWHESTVNKQQRREHMKQTSCILWFTGLSGSGKSTISVALEQYLFDHGHWVYRLDGDNIRHGLNKDLGFSAEDRTENIRRIGEVAKLFVDAGIVVMTAFISPYKSDRDSVRQLVADGEFIEIYIKCSLEECERRDTKGLYAKARAGEIPEFTGISSPYEEPDRPEIIIDSEQYSVAECIQQIIEELVQRGIIQKV